MIAAADEKEEEEADAAVTGAEEDEIAAAAAPPPPATEAITAEVGMEEAAAVLGVEVMVMALPTAETK